MQNPIQTEEEKDVYIAVLERKVLGLQVENLRLVAQAEIKGSNSAEHDDDILDWAKNRAEEILGTTKSDVAKMAARAAR